MPEDLHGCITEYIRHARERYWQRLALMNGEPDRNKDIYLLYHCGKFTIAEIGSFFGISHQAVSKILTKSRN